MYVIGQVLVVFFSEIICTLLKFQIPSAISGCHFDSIFPLQFFLMVSYNSDALWLNLTLDNRLFLKPEFIFERCQRGSVKSQAMGKPPIFLDRTFIRFDKVKKKKILVGLVGFRFLI
jgi:hypothetical protein